MTLQDLKAMSKTMLTPAEAAQVIGCDPQLIRIAARQCPETLHFPVIVIGNRVKIPRVAFINFLEGRINKAEAAASQTRT